MTPCPHDAAFKALLSDPAHAGGALRAALPARLAAELDWETLEPAPSSFIDDELRASHADLVFSARWRGEGAGDGADRAYVVFEHQSSSDRRMAFRLVRYIVRIWDRWSAENPDADELPMIVAVVLYHGEGAWTAPGSLEELIRLPVALRAGIERDAVRFAYHLDDLSRVSDAALVARDMTSVAKLTELCLKRARQDVDVVAMLDERRGLLADIAAQPGGPAALALALRYILRVNVRAEPDAVRALLERAIGPEAKDSVMENLMSYGERLIEQGRSEGKAAMLLAQLRQRFGAEVDAAVERRVAEAPAVALDGWSMRVLSAATLADVLGAERGIERDA